MTIADIIEPRRGNPTDRQRADAIENLVSAYPKPVFISETLPSISKNTMRFRTAHALVREGIAEWHDATRRAVRLIEREHLARRAPVPLAVAAVPFSRNVPLPWSSDACQERLWKMKGQWPWNCDAVEIRMSDGSLVIVRRKR